MSEDSRDIFLIIDGHALIYRAFHALPRSLVSTHGLLTNAVFGFSRILLKVINDFGPEYLVVTFDHKDKTFRHKDFKDYKAHRPEMPDQLKPQIDIIKRVVKTMNIPVFEMAGYEADDLIGTLSILNKDNDVRNLIVTGDKDMFQLVTSQTHVFIPGRGRFSNDKVYDTQAVKEKMGVRVGQIVDLKALMGDASDNIPGIKGVGPKTAVSLLLEFDNLQNLYDKLDDLDKNKKLHKLLKGSLLAKLISGKESAFLSQRLAKICTDVELEFNLESCRVKHYDKQKVVSLFDELDFKSLAKMLPKDEFESSVQQALF